MRRSCKNDLFASGNFNIPKNKWARIWGVYLLCTGLKSIPRPSAYWYKPSTVLQRCNLIPGTGIVDVKHQQVVVQDNGSNGDGP